MVMMLVLAFVSSFVFVALLGATVAWGLHVRAELKAWKEWRRQVTEAETNPAWHANQMVAS